MTAETEPELFGHLVAFKSSSCSKELYTITPVIPSKSCQSGQIRICESGSMLLRELDKINDNKLNFENTGREACCSTFTVCLTRTRLSEKEKAGWLTHHLGLGDVWI